MSEDIFIILLNILVLSWLFTLSFPLSFPTGRGGIFLIKRILSSWLSPTSTFPPLYEEEYIVF